MTTATLYKIVQSELINKGYNEFFDKDNRLILFDNDQQFMYKIMSYDSDVQGIMDSIFNGLQLKDPAHDQHFKKTFFYKFINRQINRQTIETFKFELMSTFLMNQDYINRIYTDMEKYIVGHNETKQDNTQDSNDLSTSNSKNNTNNITESTSTGNTTTDNRQARSDLPQSSINLDVNNSVMSSANENDISRNKQNNAQNNKDEQSSINETENKDQSESHSSGETNSLTKSYQLDELFKTHGVLDQVMNVFDVKCFLQFW